MAYFDYEEDGAGGDQNEQITVLEGLSEDEWRKSEVPPVLYDDVDGIVVAKMRGWPKGGVRRYTKIYFDKVGGTMQSSTTAAKTLVVAKVGETAKPEYVARKNAAAVNYDTYSDTSCYDGDDSDKVYEFFNAAACWVFRQNSDQSFTLRFPPHMWTYTKEGKLRIMDAFRLAKPEIVTVWNKKIARGRINRLVGAFKGVAKDNFDEDDDDARQPLYVPNSTDPISKTEKPKPLSIRQPTPEELSRLPLENLQQDEYYWFTFDVDVEPVVVRFNVRLKTAYRTGVAFKLLPERLAEAVPTAPRIDLRSRPSDDNDGKKAIGLTLFNATSWESAATTIPYDGSDMLPKGAVSSWTWAERDERLKRAERRERREQRQQMNKRFFAYDLDDDDENASGWCRGGAALDSW